MKPEPVQTHPLQPGPLTEEIAAGATPVMADTESATEHVPIPLQRKPNAFTSRKPVKGDVEVKFRNDSAWDRNLDFIGPGHSLGTQTKKLSFGDGFVLTEYARTPKMSPFNLSSLQKGSSRASMIVYTARGFGFLT